MTVERVGILGAGGIAEEHVRAYRANEIEVVAAADTDPVARRRARREWRIDKVFSDYRRLVEMDEIDAVSVCLPNATHHAATLAAARSGMHVLCEKPISTSLREADEMIEACAQAGVVLQIGHHLRSSNLVRQAVNLIRAGAIGELAYVRLRQAHDWAGAASVGATFGTLSLSGGGTLLDNGCHLMDLARFIGGDVVEVQARLATRKFEIEVEDTAVVSIGFASGALGTVEAQWTATGWEQSFGVFGTLGALEYTNRFGGPIAPRLFLYRRGATGSWDSPEVDVLEPEEDPRTRSIAFFVDSIQKGQPVVCTGEDGREAVRLVLDAYRSARENTAVPVGKPNR
jgi:predicted dehydrogenase